MEIYIVIFADACMMLWCIGVVIVCLLIAEGEIYMGMGRVKVN